MLYVNKPCFSRDQSHIMVRIFLGNLSINHLLKNQQRFHLKKAMRKPIEIGITLICSVQNHN